MAAKADVRLGREASGEQTEKSQYEDCDDGAKEGDMDGGG